MIKIICIRDTKSNFGDEIKKGTIVYSDLCEAPYIEGVFIFKSKDPIEMYHGYYSKYDFEYFSVFRNKQIDKILND